jgi:DNA polymerase-1
MSDPTRPVLLLDAFSLFFRAFHALPPMSTRGGVPTSALYGLSSLLLKLFREHRPLGAAFALDPPSPTFRHALYPDYKAGRRALEAPIGLIEEIELLPALIDAAGLPAFYAEGFEADDVLATLAAELGRQGERPLVVSGDRDCLQLARGRTRVLYVARGVAATEYSDAAVQARFGVPPDLLPDYQALVGDASDNLPGVPGIGPRTAARLLARFGHLPGLIAQLDEVEPPRVREALRAASDKLLFFRSLARLRTDVPLAAGPRHAPLDVDRLRPLFEALEFSSLLPRLSALRGPEGAAAA